MRSASIFVLAYLLISTVMPVCANELSNGRLTVDFDLSGSKTADRVDSVVWINSDGTATANLAVAGGPVNCGDPQEFFGESYGDLDDRALELIANGSSAKWKQKKATSGTSKTNGKDTCTALLGKTTTVYSLADGDSTQNMMKIKRSFAFASGAQANTENLRGYVPRVSMNTFVDVIYLDSEGALQTVNIGNCPFATETNCEISDWNGKWFADDDGNGNGIVMIRDKTSKAPAEIAMDYDSFSVSNATSILLMRPGAGWSGNLTETEYLCVYDAKSWPAASRAKGKLPKGCTVK
ncbi:MAG TPA: hypothetical protein VHU23_07510 [Rhizomicrobium sp.]|jgi:hypothetical protein|nr:hypothetical protein [Rhizomicrobium sp.]